MAYSGHEEMNRPGPVPMTREEMLELEEMAPDSRSIHRRGKKGKKRG